MTHLHQPTIHAHCSFGWLFVTRKKLCVKISINLLSPVFNWEVHAIPRFQSYERSRFFEKARHQSMTFEIPLNNPIWHLKKC